MVSRRNEVKCLIHITKFALLPSVIPKKYRHYILFQMDKFVGQFNGMLLL